MSEKITIYMTEKQYASLLDRKHQTEEILKRPLSMSELVVASVEASYKLPVTEVIK